MYRMTEARKKEVGKHLNRALNALLDAQMAMLIDAPVGLPDGTGISERIEHYVAYEHAALAEASVISSLNSLHSQF